MFVSVIVEPGGVDSAKALNELLVQSGYTKIQRACWENPKEDEKGLTELKKNIDGVTDYYDKIRLYQFPIDGMFVITELVKKKWRKCALKTKSQAGEKKC